MAGYNDGCVRIDAGNSALGLVAQQNIRAKPKLRVSIEEVDNGYVVQVHVIDSSYTVSSQSETHIAFTIEGAMSVVRDITQRLRPNLED